ncbi:MAG: hypothetical protein DMG55_04360 [Acidobacteria bacterium]|nr:MAG: hypothetical protein DMG55_04360 [Acidobacteriota bacterium]
MLERARDGVRHKSYPRRRSPNRLGANAWGSSFNHRGRRDVSGCQLGSLNGAPPILAGALVEDPNSLAAPGFVDGMRECPPFR